jgi:hypothetical protein
VMSSSITPTSGDLTLILSRYHGVNPVISFFTVFDSCLEAFGSVSKVQGRSSGKRVTSSKENIDEV